jgi:hypothetical protein
MRQLEEAIRKLVKEEQEYYNVFANTYFFLSDTGSWFMWEGHRIVDGGTQGRE